MCPRGLLCVHCRPSLVISVLQVFQVGLLLFVASPRRTGAWAWGAQPGTRGPPFRSLQPEGLQFSVILPSSIILFGSARLQCSTKVAIEVPGSNPRSLSQYWVRSRSSSQLRRIYISTSIWITNGNLAVCVCVCVCVCGRVRC